MRNVSKILLPSGNLAINRSPDCGQTGNSVQTPAPIFENRNAMDLMSIDDVAGVLGKSPKTIRNWIAKRMFPAVRIGNRFMVRKKSMEAWLERQEIKPWQ